MQRVLIECNRSSMLFPVDPTTTAAELLASAANCFSDEIDPKISVLMESFGKVGVQRPLRRYEHVRDVMNSWDDDDADSLLIMPASKCGSEPRLLHASDVPHTKPAEVSFPLQYSQRKRRWRKVIVVLRNDGQIVFKKGPKAKEKDCINICHLSDFDIYTPTVRSITRKINPPEKICFAIKSQQRTSVFQETTNYVHFFCTNDRRIGNDFYTAVQGWRSWYLVNVMGEGKKKPTKEVEAPVAAGVQRQQSTRHAHQPSAASTDLQYQLGSFKPLVDVQELGDRPTTFPETQPAQTNALPTRKPSTRDRPHPPSSLPRHIEGVSSREPLVNQASFADETQRSSGTFASESLLGRAYSQRQKLVAGR